MMKKIFKEAGLNDKQIKKIETLHSGIEKKMAAIKEEAEKIHGQKRQLMQNYKSKEKDILALVDKLHAIKLKMKKEMISMKLKIRKEVTEKQWKKLGELKAEMKKKHHGK